MRGSDIFGELGVFDEIGVLAGIGVVSAGTGVTVGEDSAVSVKVIGVSITGVGVSITGKAVSVTEEVGGVVGVSDTACVDVLGISSALAEKTLRGALDKIAAASKIRHTISILGLTANIFSPVCNQELAPD